MRITAVFENLSQAEAALQDLRQAGASDARLSLVETRDQTATSSEAFGDIYASSGNDISSEDSRKRPFGDNYEAAEAPTPAGSGAPVLSAELVGGGVLVAFETDTTTLSEAAVREILGHYAVR